MLDINELLKKMEEKGCEELQLSVGLEALFKKADKWEKEGDYKFSRPDLEDAFKAIMPTAYAEYMQNKIYSGSYSIPSVGRYKLYAFSQRGSLVLIFKKAFKELDKNIKIEGLENYDLTPGITLVVGGLQRKEAGMILLNELLKKDITVVSVEENVKYSLKNNVGHVFQCEERTDFKNAGELLEIIKRVEPTVVYIEYGFDPNIISKLFNLASKNVAIILNMPYENDDDAIANLTKILDEDNNTTAIKYVKKSVYLDKKDTFRIKTVD